MSAATPTETKRQVRLRLLAAFILGAVTNLIFAPFHFFPVGIVGFCGLLWLLARCGRLSSALWTGWFFGWGHFIFGLYWIVSAFLVEPEKYALLIPFPLLGLPGLLAVFPAIAVALTWWLSSNSFARLILLGASWTLLEMARGHVLTGFPWNLAGYAFGFHESAMQGAAYVGIYGLSFIAIMVFGAPYYLLWRDLSRRLASAMLIIAVGLIALGGTRLSDLTATEGAREIKVRIVQPNIPQRDKWDPELVSGNFQRLLTLTAEGENRPDLVIWPETSATFYMDQRPDLRRLMAEAAGAMLVTGAPRVETDATGRRSYNSAVAIDQQGDIVDVADKHHLVPFGEYVPLWPVLSALGVEKMVSGGGSRGFSAAPAPGTLNLPGLPPMPLLICYEAIFPGLLHGSQTGTVSVGPILNLTNDGWFGDLTGPDQHFDMVRFRAIEQGRYLIRVAGTGISGVIDPFGRETARLQLGAQGILDVMVLDRSVQTLFATTGSLPILVLLTLLMVAALTVRVLHHARSIS